MMEFRLLYEGELLPSSNKKPRAAEKHAIRRVLHPQLRRLWHLKKNLRGMARHKGNMLGAPTHGSMNEEEKLDAALIAIGHRRAAHGYHFVPLVTSEQPLNCTLDILFLRPEEERFILQQGDIDGHLKTLFDALRIPHSEEEAGGIGPVEDEDPFFCLLEDDKLITEVHIARDQLLMLPREREVKPNDSFVIVDVKISHAPPVTFDNYFG